MSSALSLATASCFAMLSNTSTQCSPLIQPNMVSKFPYTNQPPGQNCRPYESLEASRRGFISCQRPASHPSPPTPTIQPHVKEESGESRFVRVQFSGSSSTGEIGSDVAECVHSSRRALQPVPGVCKQYSLSHVFSLTRESTSFW